MILEMCLLTGQIPEARKALSAIATVAALLYASFSNLEICVCKFCQLYFVEDMYLAPKQNISVRVQKKQCLGVAKDEWYAQVIATILPLSLSKLQASKLRLCVVCPSISKRTFFIIITVNMIFKMV